MSSFNAQQHQITWNGQAVEIETLKAADRGIAAASLQLVKATRIRLSRQGTPTSRTGWKSLARGQDLLKKAGTSPVQGFLAGRISKQAKRDVAYAERIEKLGGLVDPPGGSPRARTGTLMRSVNSYSVGNIAERYVGSGLVYAAIHEYGGTINHPGGTPFIIIKGRFIPLRKGRKGMGITKAHKIKMPARPYLRPTLAAEKDNMLSAFIAAAASGGGR